MDDPKFFDRKRNITLQYTVEPEKESSSQAEKKQDTPNIYEKSRDKFADKMVSPEDREKARELFRSASQVNNNPTLEISFLTEAIKLDPYIIEAYSNLVSAYIATYQFDKAKTTIRQALSVDSESYQFHLKLARISLELAKNEISIYLDKTDKKRDPQYQKNLELASRLFACINEAIMGW